MHLSSARDLKDHLLAATASYSLSREFPAKPLVMKSGSHGLQRPACRPGRGRHPVSIGISRLGGEFRLAVRTSGRAGLHDPLLRHIEKASCGEVDIRHMGVVRRLSDAPASTWNRSRTRPLMIGASVGHVDVPVGSIGAFVNDRETPCLLSNNHILANENRATTGDPIVQPGIDDGGSDPADRIAHLHRILPLRWSGANLADAAIAVISPRIHFDPVTLRGLADGADARLAGIAALNIHDADRVTKTGRSTGGTIGRITAFELSHLAVGFETGDAWFDDQIEIEGLGSHAFAHGGDSGSLVVNDRFEVIALVFAGSETGGTNGYGLTYANTIHNVLSELRVTLIV